MLAPFSNYCCNVNYSALNASDGKSSPVELPKARGFNLFGHAFLPRGAWYFVIHSLVSIQWSTESEYLGLVLLLVRWCPRCHSFQAQIIMETFEMTSNLEWLKVFFYFRHCILTHTAPDISLGTPYNAGELLDLISSALFTPVGCFSGNRSDDLSSPVLN